MSKVFNTIMIILLVLGILGIVLGITVGLYRNDQLAKMQSDTAAAQDAVGPTPQGDAGDGEADSLSAALLYGNLHTILLGIGTLLTLVSVGIFAIQIRKQND
jgi:ABC-type antimicrobial peptide transport system permease subunit